MEIKIEKNIPMPTNKRGDFAKAIRALKVGESFFITEKHQSSICAAISSMRTRNETEKGATFTTRKVSQNGVDGVRIWRTK